MSQPVRAIIAVLGALAVPVAAQGADTAFKGPLRFCSAHYATNLAAGETATVRDTGLDFLVTYFAYESQSVGVYEGNHPSDEGAKRTNVRLIPGQRVVRVTDEDGSVSYLVQLNGPRDRLRTFLHIFSAAFRGNATDEVILDRFVIGIAAATGCTGRTYRGAA